MFGYLNIKKETLTDEKQGLWQTFMCGLCLSTKKLLGNFPRMFVSNDINTFNVLFHSATNTDVRVINGNCFSHPLKKRSLLVPTEITDKLAVANVLLTYWNLYDDVVDEKSLKKKIALRSLTSAYKKAKKILPKIDEDICNRCKELSKLEKENCKSIDMVSHPFAQLTQDFCSLVLAEKSNPFVEVLCYNLGKWIYLVDALDDIEKDLKKHNYNPFVCCYSAKSKIDVAKNFDEIAFEMRVVLNRIAQSFNDLNLTKYHCLLTNLFFESIRDKTETLLNKLKENN